MNISSFFRPVVRENFSTYVPSLSLEQIVNITKQPKRSILKLDSGENRWTPKIPIDWKTIEKNVALYPDSDSLSLRQALSLDLGVSPDCIVIGNGSDELIDLTCRLFLEKGKILIDFSPTFPMYAFFGRLCGATVITVPREKNYQLNVKAVKQALKKSQLAFIANPNNPTGTVIPRPILVELLSVGIPIVIDEAYFEFYGETVIDLVSEFENLIVLRTFSKWAGVAGLRVGYMVTNPTIADRIRAIKPPYGVNSFAQAVACILIQNKNLFLPSLRAIQASREWCIAEINSLPGLNAVASQASCVSVLSEQISASMIVERLLQKGIVVKLLPQNLLPNAFRMSIAPKKEMKIVIQALLEII
ncbi:MAG: histidinol-phosphate transaminase [Candidatus Woesebacteria bacterium]